MTWLYRALLYLYPASWRAEYGSEMRAIFEARSRDSGGFAGLLALWLETIPDLISNALSVQWDVMRQDLKYAARTLGRSPGFSAMAVIVAGSGIGASTAAFHLLDHVMLRPLPFPAPDRLVRLREDDLSGLGRFWDASPADYRDWKAKSLSYESMGAYRDAFAVNLEAGGGQPQRIEGALFTAEVLPTLGVKPEIGRTFTEEDDRDTSPATVILSYGLWQDQFAGDPGVLGRSVRLDDIGYTVIGVMPKGFYFPTRAARFWAPMRWGADAFEDRRNTYVFPVGRLKPGVSLQQAQAEMRTIAAQLARAYPKELSQVGIAVRGLRGDLPERSLLLLKALFGASVCVLLIACANLANLLLARAMIRRRELAVRAALGAGRERLVRQMLTESLMVSAAGGALGLTLVHAVLPLLVRLVPVSLPIAQLPSMDGRVLAFASLVTLVTGLGFGVVPSLRYRGASADDLREAGRATTGGRREGLRGALVVAEVACSVVLLAGFGLLTHALRRVEAVNPGFRPEHVLTLRTELPMPRYDQPEARDLFYRRVLEETRRLPGVVAAGYTSFLPLVMGGGIWPVEIEGHPQDMASRRTSSLRFVTPEYFRTMGIPLLAGRDIRESDRRKAPFVVLVSQSFVRRYWPGGNPLGRRISIGNYDRTIVGVVGDVHVRTLERESEPQVYASWQQTDGVAPWYAPKDLAVRTAGDPNALVPLLRAIIRKADPTQPVSDVRPLTGIVDGDTASRRVQLRVLGGFGIIAFLLAAVGIHALLAFAVSWRTSEIGLRVALGARPIDILTMTLSDGFRLALVGIAAGGALACAAGRLLQSILAGVSPFDPAAFSAAAALSLAMALGGSLLPALRATRIDLAKAMRAE